jgi:putative FmdB family regulatory protein
MFPGERGGEIMPVYDFRCAGCGHEFTLTMTIKEREAEEIKCPKCGATKPDQLLAPFFTKTSRKS